MNGKFITPRCSVVIGIGHCMAGIAIDTVIDRLLASPEPSVGVERSPYQPAVL